MATIKLHVLKPSVNNMAARVFVRAAKLDFTEDDVYGKTRTKEFLAMNPAHMTPMIEVKGLPKGVMWESCAIMQYLSNKHDITKFYPKAVAKRGMIDSAMFYLIGTLYPLVARATYPNLGFAQYAGEVGASNLDASHKAEAQKAAMGHVDGNWRDGNYKLDHNLYWRTDGKPFDFAGKLPIVFALLKNPP